MVTQYRSNRSAFNGYRRTPSDYSEIFCPVDDKRWRTKAAYVETLRLSSDETFLR
jgi:hypothetical protein